jgi:hypothetical protein
MAAWQRQGPAQQSRSAGPSAAPPRTLQLLRGRGAGVRCGTGRRLRAARACAGRKRTLLRRRRLNSRLRRLWRRRPGLVQRIAVRRQHLGPQLLGQRLQEGQVDAGRLGGAQQAGVDAARRRCRRSRSRSRRLLLLLLGLWGCKGALRRHGLLLLLGAGASAGAHWLRSRWRGGL